MEVVYDAPALMQEIGADAAAVSDQEDVVNVDKVLVDYFVSEVRAYVAAVGCMTFRRHGVYVSVRCAFCAFREFQRNRGKGNILI